MSKRFSQWLLVALALAVAVSIVGCGAKADEPVAEPAPAEQPAADQPADAPEQTPPATELKIEDLKVGTGGEAVTGKNATVHYTLWLADGTKLESSKDSGQPYSFEVGAGRVIPGWDEGVPGMKVGGTRKLTIPPDLAYGASGSGPVPPNATLTFEIELLSVD